MRSKTTKERAQRKARNKAKRENEKATKRIDVSKLLEMLNETTKLNQHLLRATAERENAVSRALKEHVARIKVLEEKLGIQHDEESKESSDQRGCVPAEGARADETGSGDEGGGMSVSGVRASGEDLPSAAPCGDGAVPDQANEEVSGDAEVVLDEGVGTVDNEG